VLVFGLFICLMVFNATFNNISVISWQSVLLVEEIEGPMLWVQISIRAKCATLCDKVCQWLATGQWFSPGPSISSTNKTDCHEITEILLKVALNTIKQINKPKTNTEINITEINQEPKTIIAYPITNITVPCKEPFHYPT
jgi:hypothetical protein